MQKDHAKTTHLGPTTIELMAYIPKPKGTRPAMNEIVMVAEDDKELGSLQEITK